MRENHERQHAQANGYREIAELNDWFRIQPWHCK